jgi:hypothetical protein
MWSSDEMVEETTADAPEASHDTRSRARYLFAGALMVLAFAGAYLFAASGLRAADTPPTPVSSAQCAGGTCTGTDANAGAQCATCDSSASDAAAACCGSASPAEPTEGSAVVEGGVQRISVDVTQGYFDPSVIVLEAGVPAEIVFSEGYGCMAEVMFKDFAIFEDLTQGGVVVNLPALEPGEYGFSCGMEMVFGTLVVK